MTKSESPACHVFFRSALRYFLLLFLGLSLHTSAEEIHNSGIRILFLGDKGHHRPADRFQQLAPTLSSSGIRYTYTESLADLNPEKLAGYDAIVIYANHAQISPAQEEALLGFVNNGGGLVPIHCASFCFLNSDKYLALVGARFKSHGTGAFRETVVAPKHPVFKGVSPIESWDETYVHEKHNPDRTVLAERVEGEHHEPYTWVRTSGKGRVFYTAWGHDERTWGNTNFQRLLINAIGWAAEGSPNRLLPRAGLAPFQYTNSPAGLPNYVAGAKWGTQGDPIRTMQQPLSPEESLKHLVTLPGFQVKPFATEPDVTKPICMQWDADGRLWIAETVDYPNNMQPMGQGRDRIKICENTDGDGRADKFTIFADKLSIPTGFVFYKNGIIVVHSGLTEYLQDTDGDLKVDSRTVLFRGWGTEDTHAGPSNLRYGFDNWIWGTVGYSGFEGVVGGKKLRFSQGIYRFKPDGSVLEFVRSSNNNTWGLGISEENIIFGSTANNNAAMYMAIPNRYYEAVNGWSASRIESIADSQEFFPLTEKVRQVDWHGRYTAGAGAALYTARQFPREYWNRVQFVAEPTGHLLGKFHLHEQGADFVACNGRNFLASDDEWTSPVAAEVGPDGALWMIDWYNYIIQHNPVPVGFEKGKGNAYETSMRDKVHGRIYRVRYNPKAASIKRKLANASSKELVAALKSDNLFWRLTAQRLLVERGDVTVVDALCALVANQDVDEIGLNVGAIHALWTLEGLGQCESLDARVSEALEKGLRHPSAGVRRAAVMVLPRTAEGLRALEKVGLIRDAAAQVRLAALLALAEMPADVAVGRELAGVLSETNLLTDVWMRDAMICAAAKNDVAFLSAAIAASSGTNNTNRDAAVRRVATHYATKSPRDSVIALIAGIDPKHGEVAGALLEGLAGAWPKDAVPDINGADGERLTTLMPKLTDKGQTYLLLLAQKWQRGDLFTDVVAKLGKSLTGKIADTKRSIGERAAAAAQLVALQDSPATIATILQQVTAVSSPELNTELIKAMAESRDAETGPALVKNLPKLTPAARKFQITTLLRRKEWAAALLDAVESGALPSTELAAEQWAQLKNNPDAAIAGRATKLSESRGVVSADRAEVVKKLLPIAGKSGDAARGKEVFTTTCAVCHTFNGQGGKVGPDLSGMGAREPKEILIDILDPNRSVEANYRSWSVSTDDGETLSGRLETETQTTVEILDAAGQKHVVQRKNIKRMETSGASIMPTGFEALPEADLAALLSYLRTSGK